MGWVVNVMPRPIYPRVSDPVATVKEAGWAPGSVCTSLENLSLHRDSIPGPSSPYRVAILTELSREECTARACLFWTVMNTGYLFKSTHNTRHTIHSEPSCCCKKSSNVPHLTPLTNFPATQPFTTSTLRYPRNPPHFMEPEGSLPRSQEL